MLALSLLAPAHAHADETAAFVMADTHTYERAIGTALTIGGHADATLVGMEGTVRWPLGERWALGARLPLVFARSSMANDLALGNLTFSATVILNAEAQRQDTYLSALALSISAPTAGITDDDGINGAARFAAFYVPDPGLYRPDTTTVRVYYSLRSQGHSYFGQLEVGLQQLIIEDIDDQTRLRLGMAVGVNVSSNIVLVAELSNVSDILDDANGEDFWHTLDVGMRANTGTGHVGLRVYLPLDRSSRDQDMLGVTLGYEHFL